MKKKNYLVLSLIGAIGFGSIYLSSCNENQNQVVTNATLTYSAPNNATVSAYKRVDGVSTKVDLESDSFNAGDVIYLSVNPSDGYQVNTVKFNGSLVRGENDIYTLTFVEGTNTLEIEVKFIETDIDDFSFEFNDETKEAVITSYSLNGNYPNPLVIPDVVTNNNNEEYKVTGINVGVFSSSGVEAIELGVNIKDVSGITFYDAPNLTTLSVNENNLNFSSENGILYNKDKTVLISVPSQYALNPNGSSDFTINDSVTSIGEYAFAKNRSLKTFNLGNKITSIGDYAFYNIFNLKSITIPDSCLIIHDYAFSNCTYLSKLNLGKGVKEIGPYAFQSCPELLYLDIPDSLEVIDEAAFTSNRKLLRIRFGENPSLKEIGVMAFSICDALKEFIAPSSLRIIKEGAFNACSQMTKLELNEGLESILDYAFERCYRLPSLVIPSSVTTIRGNPFSGCELLTATTLTFEEGSNFVNDNGAIYTNDYKTLLALVYRAPLTDGVYEIKDGCEVIDDYAFYLNISCNKVIIPTSVKTIKKAFQNLLSGAFSIEYKGLMSEFLTIDIDNACLVNTTLAGEGVVCLDGTLPYDDFIDSSVFE